MTVERGEYERLVRRSNKNRKITTIKAPFPEKNPAKVVLCKWHGLEFYVYPYDYPGTIFLGGTAKSALRTTREIRDLFAVYNCLKVFFGDWRKSRRGDLRKKLKVAYDYGTEQAFAKEKSSNANINISVRGKR